MNKLGKIFSELSGFKVIVFAVFFLNLISILSLYSSLHQQGEFTGQAILTRQIIWVLLAWAILLIFSLINYRLHYNLSFFFYFFSLILVAAVYLGGYRAMGAQRWLAIGNLTFQPSEIAKVTIIILMARFFSQPPKNNFFLDFCLPFSLVALLSLLIMKQPDLGSAMVTGLIAFFIGLFSKVKKKYFIWSLLVIVLAAPLGWNLLKSYQKARLVAFLNPNSDPLGSGYTIIQSKIAIGSGQLAGKGFLSGTQNQFNFLPERHTDFIFTVIAEEWGFLGALFILFLYWLILKKVLDKTKKIRDPFACQLSLGIAVYIFIHAFINIGMALGILPVVGLPLLFVSYGGSHLFSSFILLGIFFNISRNYK